MALEPCIGWILVYISVGALKNPFMVELFLYFLWTKMISVQAQIKATLTIYFYLSHHEAKFAKRLQCKDFWNSLAPLQE